MSEPEVISIPKVIWKTISNDDFVFRHKKYTLRVEQMDDDYWWWCAYYGDDYIAFDDPRAKTELEAKIFAESALNIHWRNNPKNAIKCKQD